MSNSKQIGCFYCVFTGKIQEEDCPVCTVSKTYEAAKTSTIQPVGCREAFEAWAKPEGFNLDVDEDCAPQFYTETETHKAWEGFKAAWNMKRESGEPLTEAFLAAALQHIHDYAKGKDLNDGFFIERCAYTALSRIEVEKP